MKIAVPLHKFDRAGGYRVLSELATAWAALGHEVTFLVSYHSGAPYFPTRGAILWLDDSGNKVEGPSPKPASARREVVDTSRLLLKGLNRYGRGFDVLLANHCFTAWPVFLSRVSAKKFYYVQAYEPEYYAQPPSARQKAIQSLAMSTYLLPLRRIVNSPIYYNYKLLRAKDYVPPGLDFCIFYPKPLAEDWGERTVVLGCIGRKAPYKGMSYVLDAFEAMVARGFDVALRVAYGNFPDGREAPSKCRVVVPQNDRELADFYRSVDVMIAPGTVQLGAPHYPVMEAMACGVTVVTTGYIPASSDNAWIVPVHDSEAIVTAVADITAKPALRLERVRRGLEAIQPFSWDRVAAKMLEIFST